MMPETTMPCTNWRQGAKNTAITGTGPVVTAAGRCCSTASPKFPPDGPSAESCSSGGVWLGL